MSKAGEAEGRTFLEALRLLACSERKSEAQEKERLQRQQEPCSAGSFGPE